ncbi:replication restart helicase PriA [Polynucleobacter sp. HIN6]|uniref:replication restart helicase PriA n=1 Tax=Polynucleobacter sp. HIN6 TaxID=3047865 RepID=UPI0025726D2C|nr:primosomal protein N' [Polynucleobacter sp. HIN6]
MNQSAPIIVKVVVDRPLPEAFDYLWDKETLRAIPQVGMLVEVPFGRTNLPGIVIEVTTYSHLNDSKLKKVLQIAPLNPIDNRLMELAHFASQYYLHGLGETIVSAIPKWWRTASNWNKPLDYLNLKTKDATESKAKEKKLSLEELNDDQRQAIQILNGHQQGTFNTFLLNGVTGSGKTAVYLTFIETLLKQDPAAQVLIMLPEINLTPQLQRRIQEYFPQEILVVLHSGLTEKQRGIAWYLAMTGLARIVLGTRLSIMTPLPKLVGIVVDEENDSSFKQQEGMAYSARDLAVWRAKNERLPIVLVSATPSSQTWQAVKEGRYQEIQLTNRAGGFQMPNVELVAPSKSSRSITISPLMIRALEQNLHKGRQSLILINRRGLAPVLSCSSCNWLSECDQCSSYMVMHRQLGHFKKPMLCCHHCGLMKVVPQGCPRCGDVDLQPLGRGTQKVEDQLQALFPQATVLRVDADTARTSKKTEALFQEIHAGSAQIIVGTQMLAKGHDYQNIGLVCVLDADARLYSNDYMAPEHLFAQLVQVAGRAGRFSGESTQILIETRYPDDPVYQYIKTFDLAGFMEHLMAARQEAGLPPFSYQALVHAEAKQKKEVLTWLNHAKQFLQKTAHLQTGITVFDPVPKSIARLGGWERSQLLIESRQRAPLQALLNELEHYLRQQSVGRISKVGKVRWSIERDPLFI